MFGVLLPMAAPLSLLLKSRASLQLDNLALYHQIGGLHLQVCMIVRYFM